MLARLFGFVVGWKCRDLLKLLVDCLCPMIVAAAGTAAARDEGCGRPFAAAALSTLACWPTRCASRFQHKLDLSFQSRLVDGATGSLPDVVAVQPGGMAIELAQIEPAVA